MVSHFIPLTTTKQKRYKHSSLLTEIKVYGFKLRTFVLKRRDRERERQSEIERETERDRERDRER